MFMKTNNMINNFSVVIPVFNEEVIFLNSAKKIYNICLEVGKPFEIIFSENGSSDNTVNLIQNFIDDKDSCFMIRTEIANYGLALKNGFKNAKNDLIISFDILPSCPTIISSESTYEAKAAPILKAISGVIDSLNTPLTS